MFVLSHNVARTKRYYINTNEVLGELSRENMISSHEKIITCEKITLPCRTRGFSRVPKAEAARVTIKT